MSADFRDPEPLTPTHLLYGCRIVLLLHCTSDRPESIMFQNLPIMLPKYKLCRQFLQIMVKIDQEKLLATCLLFNVSANQSFSPAFTMHVI